MAIPFFCSAELQQYLPLAVLKRTERSMRWEKIAAVATVLTACGIETCLMFVTCSKEAVATVLTACGIETSVTFCCRMGSLLALQQYLPLAVLKRPVGENIDCAALTDRVATVLTACGIETCQRWQHCSCLSYNVATVLTACGIETL